MKYIVEHEGPLALFKGIGPQISKGIMVQGILMMTKERYVPFSHFELRQDPNSDLFQHGAFIHTFVRLCAKIAI